MYVCMSTVAITAICYLLSHSSVTLVLILVYMAMALSWQ